MADIGGINLAATNFSDTVRQYIERERVRMLRADSVYAIPESVTSVSPNEDGITFSRKLTAWLDIPAGNSGLGTVLTEGTPPAARKLNEDSITLTVQEVGDYIPVFSQAAQQYGVAKALSVAADKAARMQQLAWDNLARSLYAAATPDLYAGNASSNATLIAGNVLTTSTLDEMVTQARERDLQPFTDGLYRFIGHPRLFKALFTEASANGGAFVNAANEGTVGDLTKGIVGDYHGARFVTAGSRGIATADVDGPALTTAANAAIASTDLITATAHGLTAGSRIKITALTGGTGLVQGTTYYVVAPVATDTFKVSATKNGAAINITADSSAFTANQVNDVYTGVLVGAGSIALADAGSIKTFIQKGGGVADPLEQTVATIGFRGFVGGTLVSIANFADGAGTASGDVNRYLTMRSVGA